MARMRLAGESPRGGREAPGSAHPAHGTGCRTVPPVILDGRPPARVIDAVTVRRAARFRSATGGRVPTLAAVAADEAGAVAHVALKRRIFARLGLELRPVRLPASTGTADALACIDALNDDRDVHGIFVQFPLPPGVDARACHDRVALAKDVDASGAAALGRLLRGDPLHLPATPAAALRLLVHYGIPLAGTRTVVVEGEPIMAQPLTALLLRGGALVSVHDPDDPDLAAAVGSAALLVAASGRPGAIPGTWLRDGAVVVDTGYYHPGAEGEVLLAGEAARLAAYTPHRGGLGPLTVALLAAATARAAERAVGLDSGADETPPT